MLLTRMPYNSPDKEDSTPNKPLPRCSDISRTGKHCRYLAISWGNPFCKTHAKPPDPADPLLCSELTDIMEVVSHNFQTPAAMNSILYTIFFALAEGRITERRAGVMCYIIQTVLHTQRAITLQRKNEEKAAAERLAKEPWRRLPKCLWPAEYKTDNDSTTQTKVAPSQEENSEKETGPSTEKTAGASEPENGNPGNVATADSGAGKAVENDAYEAISSPAAKPAPTAPPVNYLSLTLPYIPQFPLPRPAPHEQAELDSFDRLSQRGSVRRPPRFGFSRYAPPSSWRSG